MTQFDMAFEGGGAKGVSFAGALQVLSESGHTHRRLVGTSAGAISATLLAAGYSPDELLSAMTERLPNGKMRCSTFMDPPRGSDFTDAMRQGSEAMEILRCINIPGLPKWDRLKDVLLCGMLQSSLFCQIFSFIECGGFFSGNAFLEWICEKLEAKGIDGEDTLRAFFERTWSDLSLVVTDTTDREMLVLNHRTAPECPISFAVRMSMSIPFVWAEVTWQGSWGLYLGREKTGNKMVDGGVLSNFPIHLIDVEPGSDPFVMEVMGNTSAATAGTLGLLIDETLPVKGAEETAHSHGLTHHLKTTQRLCRLINTMTDARDNAEIRLHESCICRLPAKGYGTTEFDMSPDRLKALLDSGRAAMKEHLWRRQM